MSAEAELMLPCGKLISACAELMFALMAKLKVNFLAEARKFSVFSRKYSGKV